MAKRGNSVKMEGMSDYFTVLCMTLMLPGTILEEHGYCFIDFGHPK